MRHGPLIRENDETFRDAKRPEEGKKALAYFLYTKRASLRFAGYERIATNASDHDLDWDRSTHRELLGDMAMEAGRKLLTPEPERDFADKDREQYGIVGGAEFEDPRILGFIGPDGADYSETRDLPIFMDIHTRDTADRVGSLWYSKQNEYLDEGFYFSIYVSRERLLWVFDQLEKRPSASLIVTPEFKVFQHEADNFLAEPDQRQDWYIETNRQHELTDVAFYVKDPARPKPTASSGLYVDDDLPGAEPQTPMMTDVLLKRLNTGVKWVIGLLVVLILSTLAKQ